MFYVKECDVNEACEYYIKECDINYVCECYMSMNIM